jgi:ceramide glucosyltransferase
MTILLAALGLLLAGSLVYSVLSVIAAIRYLAAVRPPAPSAPEPISVLKPLAGLDDGLEQNLRTFFTQDYPQFEIVFAVLEA